MATDQSVGTIVLRVEGGGWVAEFLGDSPGALSVVDLFGTRVLPTSFLARCDSGEVRSWIASKWPGWEVRLCVCRRSPCACATVGRVP